MDGKRETEAMPRKRWIAEEDRRRQRKAEEGNEEMAETGETADEQRRELTTRSKH